MSFGGFFGGVSSEVGDARMVADNIFSNSIPNSAIVHSRQHMVSHPPIVQPIFNSSPLSLGVKPKMEGAGDIVIMENIGTGVMERARDEDIESRSGSDNNDGASGDDQDAHGDNSTRRKKYHRHTPHQIQELEAAFKENPHPDEKARLELGRRLNLESKQVKFWFQNRRTQMKTQMERHENTLLKQDNDRLRIENIAIKEAMRNPACSNCGGPASLGEISVGEHHLRIENARLRDELNRTCILANKFFGRPLSSLASSMATGNSDLELAVGRNGFGGVSSVGAAMPIDFDFGGGITNPLLALPSARSSMGMTGYDVSIDKSMYLNLAMTAMAELLKLTQVDNPLWYQNIDGFGEVLNIEEYTRTFPPHVGMKPNNLVSEATRASGTVIINAGGIVEMLMDASRWTEMFSCMLGKATTVAVISTGVGGTRDGTLQLMHAEFQVLSPLVAVRQARFLRFSKQQREGFWVFVDVSVDPIGEDLTTQTFADCRRLPSGCVVQDLPNGYSKVIWVEHMEYDQNNVHQSYRHLLSSGLGFGAQKWVATLERQCECLAVLMSSTVSGGDQAAITPSGRRSLAKLAQRMTHNFCAGVCGTVHKWDIVQVGNADDARLMMRTSEGTPGDPPGVILSATMTIWMPVSPQSLFDFLRNEQTRSQWDVLSHDGPIQPMFHVAKGQDLGNSICVLRSNVSGTASSSNQNSILILQETSSDISGSLISYAAVDIPAMNVVMGGGDSSCVVLLPSGFSIVPDCYPESSRMNSSTGTLGAESTVAGISNGSLLTIGFQILVSSSPESKLTMESVDTVNALISRTLRAIKSTFQCN